MQTLSRRTFLAGKMPGCAAGVLRALAVSIAVVASPRAAKLVGEIQ